MHIHEQDNIVAELAAINTALVKTLSALASLAELNGVSRDAYFGQLLGTGLQDIDRAEYPGVEVEEIGLVIENARAKYSSLIAAASRAPIEAVDRSPWPPSQHRAAAAGDC